MLLKISSLYLQLFPFRRAMAGRASLLAYSAWAAYCLERIMEYPLCGMLNRLVEEIR